MTRHHAHPTTATTPRWGMRRAAPLVAALLVVGCGDDSTDAETTDAGAVADAGDPADGGSVDLSKLNGDWMSEAAFLDAPELDSAFERLAELNPGHTMESARAFWKEFRASGWTDAEVDGSTLRFEASGTLLCEGAYAFRGTHPVGVSSWAVDQEAHPAREIPVDVFELVDGGGDCDASFRFVWVLGGGSHGHLRNDATLEAVLAPTPWWPTLRPSGTTVDEFAAMFAEQVEQFGGALPLAE